MRVRNMNLKSTFSDLRAAHRSARRQAGLGRVLSRYAFGGPLDQAVRWHLFYDGERVISVVAQGTGATLSWSQGPARAPAELANSDRLRTLAKELSHGMKPSMLNQTNLG